MSFFKKLFRLNDASSAHPEPSSATFNAVRESSIDPDIRELLDNILTAYTIWNANGELIDCNDAALQLFRVEDKVAFCRHFLDLSPEFQPCGRRSSDLIPEQVANAVKSGRNVFQWEHQTSDGKTIPCEIILTLLPGSRKKLLLACLRDLRSLNLSQEERREAEERTRIMLDATPLCCNFWDENLQNVDCNQEAVNLFHLKDKNEYLEKFDQLSPKRQPNGRSSQEMAYEKIRIAFQTGRTRFEWMHQMLDGTPIPSEITLVRVRRGERDIVVGYTRDLRELKQTQSELEKERLLLLEILNSSPVCFAFMVGGHVRFSSPFMTNLLGVQTGDILEKFFADPDQGIQLRENFEEQGRINWSPVSLRSSHDGSVKEMLANIFPVDLDDEHASMVWLVDVTDIRRAEADLRLARDAAEASARAKSDFLANMSHEIRTPMNAILGMTHLVLKTELGSKQKEYIESVQQSARILLRIINDILDFSKIEAGKMVMEYRDFALLEVIEEMRSVVDESLRKKNLALEVDMEDGLPTTLMGDSVRLRQILLNLVNNAIKFTEQGEIRLSIRVREKDELSTMLLISVRDTGIGMKPGQIQHLFKPFTQADSSTTRKYGGTGLGLAISKSIVEMMKGEIWCESEFGRGTTFSFTARFGLPLEGEIPPELLEIRTDVLLLGDRPESLKTVRHYLELLKCKIIAQCATCEQFDAFLKQDRLEKIDFVLLDFDEITESLQAALKRLQEYETARRLPLVFTELPGIDSVIKKLDLPAPVHKLERPVVVSELFNVVMAITARKKEEMITARKMMAKGGETTSAPSGYVIPEEIRGALILLAEDNRINQMVATELLQMEGFQVDVAENGQTALDMLEQKNYDLVLMDIQMPEIDGLEATKILRRNPKYKNLPVLAMTAHAMTGDRELSLEAGMNDHITKPIDPVLLYRTLAKWIKRKDG